MEESASLVVQLSPVQAAAGTTRMVPVPPDGRPVMVYFPPGARDGAVLRVPVPRADSGATARATRTLAVVVRVVATEPWPMEAFPPQAAPPPGYPPQAAPSPGYPPQAAPSPVARRRLWPVAGGLAAVLAIGLCAVPAALRRGNPATRSANVGSIGGNRAAGSTAAAVPLDPAAYQSALDSAGSRLRSAIAALQRAATPRAVTNSANALADEAKAQAAALSAVTAPVAAGPAHHDLVFALSGLETELSDVAGSAEVNEVCTGGAASATLSRADAAKDLRAAVTALATADPGRKYRFGSFLPTETRDRNRHQANGTYLTRTTGGLGQLQITNSHPADAVVNLVRKGARKPAVSVYVRGRQRFTTGRIEDGTYQVYLATGTDWDGRRFTRDCDFSRFDSEFPFTTTAQQYTIWKLSLQVRLSGNATTSEVDPDSFPA